MYEEPTVLTSAIASGIATEGKTAQLMNILAHLCNFIKTQHAPQTLSCTYYPTAHAVN